MDEREEERKLFLAVAGRLDIPVRERIKACSTLSRIIAAKIKALAAMKVNCEAVSRTLQLKMIEQYKVWKVRELIAELASAETEKEKNIIMHNNRKLIMEEASCFVMDSELRISEKDCGTCKRKGRCETSKLHD